MKKPHKKIRNVHLKGYIIPFVDFIKKIRDVLADYLIQTQFNSKFEFSIESNTL